ncbi:hypothetical protein ACOJBZ_11015 [Enterococcus innesii]|uniref:hypothetical protein n=1 Tax=Enterococcus innesii TaxID=2839759 RepID=UPI003B5B9600
MDNQVKLLIVGAIISFFSTLLGFLGQTFVQYLIANKGQVRIYIKKVYSKVNYKPCGFTEEDGDIIFSVPIWIEFHNTKEKREVIRNVNLQLYHEGEKISGMFQATKMNESVFANGGAYSFILEPLSICQYDLQYFIKRSETEGNFDEVRLSFYDSRDIYHERKILCIDSPWVPKTYGADKDWILIN